MTESRGLDVDGGDGNYRGDVMQIIEGENGQAAGFKLRSVADFYVVEQGGIDCLKDASRPTSSRL